MMHLKFRLCTNAETLGIEKDQVEALYDAYDTAYDILREIEVADVIEIEMKHESLFSAWNGGYCQKAEAKVGPIALTSAYVETEDGERRYFSRYEGPSLPRFVLDAMDRAYDVIAPVLSEIEAMSNA